MSHESHMFLCVAFSILVQDPSGTLRQALKTDMYTDKVSSVTVKLICRNASYNCFHHFLYKYVSNDFYLTFVTFDFVVNILFHCLIFYKIEIMTMQQPSMVRIGILMVCQILLLVAAGFACVYIIQSSSTTPSSGKLMIHNICHISLYTS